MTQRERDRKVREGETDRQKPVPILRMQVVGFGPSCFSSTGIGRREREPVKFQLLQCMWWNEPGEGDFYKMQSHLTFLSLKFKH